jgi:hypothetical protein
MNNNYKVLPGPEGFLAPAAAFMGVELPDEGYALMEGTIIEEKAAIINISKKLVNAKKPAIFLGPLVLWDWKDGVREKAKLIKELAGVTDSKLIPMPDYRHKHPKINPEIEISPNHPNLTISHNDIDVCVFVGVHSHYVNMALKIIRGETDCYTIVLGEKSCHEDAMLSIGKIDNDKLQKLIDVANSVSV